MQVQKDAKNVKIGMSRTTIWWKRDIFQRRHLLLYVYGVTWYQNFDIRMFDILTTMKLADILLNDNS